MQILVDRSMNANVSIVVSGTPNELTAATAALEAADFHLLLRSAEGRLLLATPREHVNEVVRIVKTASQEPEK